MKLGEIRISRATTNEPNEPSRAREISARPSPSRAGITLLVRWLRGGSARSYARLVWLVCDARRVCSARCQPCLDDFNYPENDHRRIRKYNLRRSRLPMSIFEMLCVQLDQAILLVGPRSTLSTESAVHSYIAPVLIPSINDPDLISRYLTLYAHYLKGGSSINQK